MYALVFKMYAPPIFLFDPMIKESALAIFFFCKHHISSFTLI